MTSSTAARSIAAIFGLVFVLVNASATSRPWPVVLGIVGVLAFAGAALAVARSPRPSLTPRLAAIRVYWVSVALEGVAIVVGARVLNAHGHAEYGVAWVAFVVGVHFLPFAWAWRLPSFRWLGLALIALAAAAAAAGVAGAGRGAIALIAGVASGFVLLVFAAVGIPAGERARRSPERG